MTQLTLSLHIHDHQPVGNFDRVFSETADRAHAPLLEARESHPGLRLTLQCSDSALDRLVAGRTSHRKRLANLVAPQQVELLTGGYHERVSCRCLFSK
jgi:alpha-amylase